MFSTGKEPAAEELPIQSSSSFDDSIAPNSSDICSGGIDPSEVCLIDLTGAACKISSSSEFTSRELGGQGTRHLDVNVNMWPLGTNMNCTKTIGQSSTDIPGQSLVNGVIQGHFPLEYSICMTAGQMELALKQRLLADKTNDDLGAHIENHEDRGENNALQMEKTALRIEERDDSTIQRGCLGKTSDADQTKTPVGRRFSMQAEVGSDSSCDDLLSRKTEDVHYYQSNPHCVFAEAATNCNHQQPLSSVDYSSITRHMMLVMDDSLRSYNDALYQCAINDVDFIACSQCEHKSIVPEQPEHLEAVPVQRPMFLWQYLYPASLNTSVSWSTECVQDKGWHQSSPGSFVHCQSLPISSAATDASTKTGASNYLISKAPTTSPVPDRDHLFKGCATSAAEDAVKSAPAMFCPVSAPSASSLTIGALSQMGSEVHDHQLNMTPFSSPYGTGEADHEGSNKRRSSLENPFRSPRREFLKKTAEKRKALLCSTVDVYGHNQPRCYGPPVNNNRPNVVQSHLNNPPITRQTPLNTQAVICPSSPSQPMSSIPSPVHDLSKSSLPIPSPSSSSSHRGPGHECPNMIQCTTCVLAFSRQLALALASEVMCRRSATASCSRIRSKRQDDKDKNKLHPLQRS